MPPAAKALPWTCRGLMSPGPREEVSVDNVAQ